MTRTMTILHVNGNRTVVTLNPKQELYEMQTAVGGYIELVPYFETFEGEPCEAYCDEEGKLKYKPTNHAATALWASQINGVLNDILVGDVIIIQPPETT